MYHKSYKKIKSLGKPLKISFRKSTQQIIHDICSIAPYEKKIIELIKLGNDKKALKLGKKRLGNISRSKKKKEYLNTYMRNKSPYS
jgi:large subunit ribosomal protein L36e